jgi:hypothetical protein
LLPAAVNHHHAGLNNDARLLITIVYPGLMRVNNWKDVSNLRYCWDKTEKVSAKADCLNNDLYQ